MFGFSGVVSDAAAAPHVPEDTATPPPVNHKIPEEGVDPLPTGGNKAALVNGQSVRATGRRGGRKKRITFTREPSSTEEESESEKYVSSPFKLHPLNFTLAYNISCPALL